MSDFDFTHLHLHTEYSIIDGLVRIEELIPACKKAEMSAVAITDQCNFFGLIKFYKAAITAGIKPIVGANILLTNERSAQPPSHITLLAQNQQGYKNLIQLLSLAYVEGQKLGVPITQWPWLEELNGGIIILSGARNGDIGQALLQKDDKLTSVLVQRWQKFFPDRFYIELQRTGRAGEREYIDAALDLAEKQDLPVVATNDVCFLNPGDFEAHEARVCINAGYVLEDQNRPRIYSEQQYLRTPEEMIELFSDIPEAIVNTVEITKRCNVELTLGKTFLPVFPVPKTTTAEKLLEENAKSGLVKRLQKQKKGDDASAATIKEAKNIDSNAIKDEQIYTQRLQYELSVINQMGFPSYFLIVADFILWAKNNGVPVGPGRGSGAGSLVAYALGITDLDPISHDLLFERFLNPERVSLPDFDIDFCMDGRDRVIDYVVNHYGRDKVAQIITYGTMAARAVVRDVGRVLGYPYGFVDKIAKLIPFELGISLDKALEDEEILRKRYEEEDDVHTLIDLAKKLEGITRNVGKHAGGIVIAPSKLTDFTALYREADDAAANVVTQFDKEDVEAVGLVKFDFLGLRTLTIINWALETINAKRIQQNQVPLDITAIPLDDEDTYKLLQDCVTVAIFQLESRGMRELVKRLQPDCFDDLVALVALYRPGPLQSGMVDDFINRKHGREKVTYLHQALGPVLTSTYGVILYQEQVMQIAQVLAGYSLGSADLLRRAMGKKKAEEMAKQRTIFVEGALNQNIDKHVANTIFDLMEKFAGYGFNKSHSAAYALISYQTAWLKTHYPAEFMAAVLSSDMDNTDKVVLFINECKRLGLIIEPPDINVGEYKFTVKANTDNTIIYGLGAIKGVGLAAIESILTNREKDGVFRDVFDFCKRVETRKANRRVIEGLNYAGAFDRIAPNRASLSASISIALQFAEQDERKRASGQLSLFEMLEDEDANLAKDAASQPQDTPKAGSDYVMANEWPEEIKLKNEKSVLGFYLSGHLINRYLSELAKIVTCNIADINIAEHKKVVIAGFIIGTRIFNTKNGNKLAVVTLEDHTGNVDLTVFSELYLSAHDNLQEGQLIIVDAEITIDKFTGGERARATSIRSLENTRMASAKYLLLKFQDEMLKMESGIIDKLQHILVEYKNGSAPVYIAYSQEDTKNSAQKIKAQLQLGNEWRVQLKDSLLLQLHELLGIENVVVCYK